MTARIREFLKKRSDNGPCLVVDLDVVRENYQNFAKALPDTKVFYAVKANPAPEILKLLADLGCCFDVASLPETHAALAAGAPPERISYGNTIKKEAEIAAAFALGITLFAVDCEAEVEKVDPRRARQPGDLPDRLRRLRRRVAALAQVRLRTGLCRRHSGPCA
jgi:ornithine decarboxylase